MTKIQNLWMAALTTLIGWILPSCNTYHTVAPLYGVPPTEDSIGQMICLYGVPPGLWEKNIEPEEAPEQTTNAETQEQPTNAEQPASGEETTEK